MSKYAVSSATPARYLCMFLWRKPDLTIANAVFGFIFRQNNSLELLEHGQFPLNAKLHLWENDKTDRHPFC